MEHNIAYNVKNAPFNWMGFSGSAFHPMKMPACSAVCICLQQIQTNRVNVEDHVGCVESYRRIRVHGQIIEELFGFEHGIFYSVCLFTCNCTECHEHCEIDGPGIVHNASNYALDMLDVVL